MAKRTDSNHAEIVTALRAYGCCVVSLAALGKGCPDLLVGKLGKLKLIEVKDGSKAPSKQQLTDDEYAFHKRMADAGCPVEIIRSLDDVRELMLRW